MIESEAQLKGRRLEPRQVVHFRCHPDLSCFGTCCARKRLTLFPYDLLRLRAALQLPSQEILEQFVAMEVDPESGWPLFRLGLDDTGRCPFVGGTGCEIYEDRPACCRIYPLAHAAAPAPDGGLREVYFAEESPSCLGWEEPRAISVVEWVAEQGLPPYQQANRRTLRLLLHPRRRQPMALEERELHAYVLGLYNLDVFRQALGVPGFRSRCVVEPSRLEAATTDDEVLLELGHDWVEGLLFGPARP